MSNVYNINGDKRESENEPEHFIEITMPYKHEYNPELRRLKRNLKKLTLTGMSLIGTYIENGDCKHRSMEVLARLIVLENAIDDVVDILNGS